MIIGIKGRILNSDQMETLLSECRNSNLTGAISLAYFNGLKINKILIEINVKRRTLQHQLTKLGQKIFGFNVTFEMIRWSCMIKLFNQGYTAEYISELFEYSKAGDSLKAKRNMLGYVSNKLRMEILVRDNFECVFCGSNHKIQVDHIVPTSKGGRGIESNLQTLCLECNVGKYNKIIFKDKHKEEVLSIKD